MKTLIGICTFGGINFSKLAYRSIMETASEPVDVAIIVGKPGDVQTGEWATELAKHSTHRVHVCFHKINLGFPVACNDMIDLARNNGYDNLIIMGNDVVAYPGAIDAMIREAARGEWEWICGSQFDSKSLYERYPEIRHYFHGPNLEFRDFDARPWEIHKEVAAPAVEPGVIRDVQNLTLFRVSAFDRLGYFDASYWPNGYYSDNCYCLSANRIGVKSCVLAHAPFYHAWSRTIHQGEGRPNGKYFDRNGQYYDAKWGGNVNKERYSLPFDGQPYQLCDGVVLEPTLKIGSREQEPAIVQYWSTL